LARRSDAGAAHRLHGGPPPDCGQRQNRRTRFRVRHRRHRRPRRPLQLGAAGLQDRRRGRRQHAAGHHRRHRQPARLRRAQRRQALGVQLGGAAGQPGARQLGGRQLEGSTRRQRVAVLLHARRAARAALPAAGVADRRRLRRRPQGRQPLRQLGGRRRRADRRVQVALPDHSPRAVGSRSARTVPALGVTTKSSYLYILNRETGQPIFGVEERPVPKSDVPGEAAFATQPIPVKPPPLGRVAYKPDDLVTESDTTAEHAKACADFVAANGGLYNAGPFTPWAYRADGAPPKVTLNFPGGLGGANWGGIAFDRRTGYMFVVSQDIGALGWIEKAKDGSPVPYDKATPERVGPGRGAFDIRVGDSNWPCQKPPWGRLTAINASTGDVAWQVPLGVTDQLPAAKQNTGRP